MSNSKDITKQKFDKLFEESFGRLTHIEKRLDEYWDLMKAIDELCQESESKLSIKIQELIDKHYIL